MGGSLTFKFGLTIQQKILKFVVGANCGGGNGGDKGNGHKALQDILEILSNIMVSG